MNVLDFEIAQEQAEALGLAGKKLQAAIDRFDNAVRERQSAVDDDSLLSDIASRAWALIVQRELMGFKHENLRWVLEHFEIPDAALRRLGRSDRA